MYKETKRQSMMAEKYSGLKAAGLLPKLGISEADQSGSKTNIMANCKFFNWTDCAPLVLH